MQIETKYAVGQEVFCIAAEDPPVGRARWVVLSCVIDRITITSKGISYHRKCPSSWHGRLYFDNKIYDNRAEPEKIVAEMYSVNTGNSFCDALFRFLQENGFKPKKGALKVYGEDVYELRSHNERQYVTLTTSYYRHKGLIETILASFFPSLTTSDIDVYAPADGLSSERIYVLPINKDSNSEVAHS